MSSRHSKGVAHEGPTESPQADCAVPRLIVGRQVHAQSNVAVQHHPLLELRNPFDVGIWLDALKSLSSSGIDRAALGLDQVGFRWYFGR